MYIIMSIRKLFYLLTFTQLCALTTFSQSVKGFVYDAETHEPLIGVNIIYKQLNGETDGTISDADGAYRIQLPEGGSNLIFSYIGYENETVPILIRKDVEKIKDVYLNPQTNLLDNVVISAGRFEQKLSNITVSMDVLKASDISRQAPTDLSESLNKLPGVDINDKQPSIRGGNGWTYGVGSRSVVLVDGMSVLTSGNGIINWNVVPLENIEQVEVMKGASSVLYGSSALNGVINIRTKRPNLKPVTTARAYVGVYNDPESWDYNQDPYWKNGYDVTPLTRRTVLNKVKNPVFEGVDFSHARRAGNFDISAGLNLFNDEGYRKHAYNRRYRIGGNLTYHQPLQSANLMNYGFNTNFLSDKYGDFFIWRSPAEAYTPSPITNMGRKGNTFYIDPFFNFINPEKQIEHRIKGRFYYRGDHIIQSSTTPKSIMNVLDEMDTDYLKLISMATNIAGGNYKELYPLILPLLSGNTTGLMSGLNDLLGSVFPGGNTNSYNDLISSIMNVGLPSGLNELGTWLNDTGSENASVNSPLDKNYTYYLDYLFNKKWESGAQLTAGVTYEHMKSISQTTGTHNSDNVAGYAQYDQRFFDKLSVSAGMRAEYYRVDDFRKEAETDIFGVKVPVKPIFRAGVNYQLADFSFIRASFGQGYRYPSLTEKYARKDIGGAGVYPNHALKAEKGLNAELGFKQGYRLGNITGFVDLAGFYTEYKDMIEFRFGFFNNSTFEMINSIPNLLAMIMNGQTPGVGAQFYNVSKARIYGVELSTNGVCQFRPNLQLSYNLGYVFIEPEDCKQDEKNKTEALYTDPLQMKEKSNTSKYLKYRQKNTVKGIFDLQWNRINLGTNIQWKSKTLAVDYFMIDERQKAEPEIMDYVRTLLFGYANGETLHSYWEKNNKPYWVVDLRCGVKVTREASFQFMVNNVFNKTYSVRPMALGAPRTYMLQFSLNL